MSKVERLWPGSTVVCIASGPSLTREDVEFVRGKAKVIVINTSYQIAPWADVLYACDDRWWRWERGAPSFHGLKFALTPHSARWPGVTVLKNTGESGLELKPTGLRTGKNSGYQAVNLAVHLGAQRIVLLGYDMQKGPNGKDHWHADHPSQIHSPYAAFLKNFTTLVKPLQELGIDVINCTRKTALTCFTQMSLAEALSSVEAQVA